RAGLLAERLDVSGGVVRHGCVLSSRGRGSGLAGGRLVGRGGVRRRGIVGHLGGVGARTVDDGGGLVARLRGGRDLLGVVRGTGGLLGGVERALGLLGAGRGGLGALLALVRLEELALPRGERLGVAAGLTGGAAEPGRAPGRGTRDDGGG